MARRDEKTNRLSIYLIKSEFSNVEEIVSSSKDAISIDEIGHFVFEDSRPHQPEWVKGFFGTRLDDALRLITSSARGVLVVPVLIGGAARHFALSFGTGRFMLKENVIEERFGLKVVLNSVNPDSIRSVGKTTLGSVTKNSREQLSRASATRDFGIDIEQDLVREIAGTSKDDRLGKTISGKDALSVSVKVNVGNIRDFLSHCFDRYSSTDYKAEFEWIDHLAEVRDSRITEMLWADLVNRINAEEFEKLWMAIPEIVNWAELLGFRYLRENDEELHEDLDFQGFLAALGEAPVALPHLTDSLVFMISSVTDSAAERWPAYRCIYAESTLENKCYVLNNGKWYEIARDFAQLVINDFRAVPQSTLVLPDCAVKKEDEYNLAAAKVLGNACCLDKNLIAHGGGKSTIEFCDLYTDNKQMVHVKKYGGSNVFSHLFSQGVVAGELFVTDGDFRRKLNEKLPGTHRLKDPSLQPEAKEYEVVYAIISDSDKALDLPFFSKLNLRNARRRLGGFGYQVTIRKIQKT